MARAGAWLKRLVLPVRRRSGFARDERGTTAIEFAILGIPFFSIIAAILETSMVFLAGQVLDSAVNDSGRLIRTGQAQGDYSVEDFRTAICSGLYGLFDCSQLRINVSVVATFGEVEIEPPVDPDACDEDDCEWTLPETYNSGTGDSIVLVQAYYKWPTLLQFGGFNLENLGNGTRLLASVRVFRNEPFGDVMTGRSGSRFIDRLRRFPVAREAVAAVEFALILPFMLLLYLGSIELSDVIAVDRRVTIVAGTIGDLVARTDGELAEDTLDDYFTAAAAIIRPYSGDGLMQVVTSVYVDPDGDTSVQWSRGFNGGVAHVEDDAYELPDEITDIALNNYVIVSESSYAYRPLLGLVFTEAFNLYRENFFLPRFGAAITIDD